MSSLLNIILIFCFVFNLLCNFSICVMFLLNREGKNDDGKKNKKR